METGVEPEDRFRAGNCAIGYVEGKYIVAVVAVGLCTLPRVGLAPRVANVYFFGQVRVPRYLLVQEGVDSLDSLVATEEGIRLRCRIASAARIG